jgi:hypothetical protein
VNVPPEVFVAVFPCGALRFARTADGAVSAGFTGLGPEELKISVCCEKGGCRSFVVMEYVCGPLVKKCERICREDVGLPAARPNLKIVR